jgi:hypothetical protein
MGKCMTVVLFAGILSCAVCSGVLRADNGVSNKDEGVKKNGVTWNIAQDRNVILFGGAYQPEGLDLYMQRYFDQFLMRFDLLAKKIDQLNEQNGRLEKKVDELLSKSNKSLVSQAQKNP